MFSLLLEPETEAFLLVGRQIRCKILNASS
jgi:hypothetical protein